MNSISDKEIAVLKRAGMDSDDPNLKKMVRILGDSFGINTDDC